MAARVLTVVCACLASLFDQAPAEQATGPGSHDLDELR